MQTSPIGTFPTTLREAAPKIYAAEGLNGFYKSLVPLWGRQVTRNRRNVDLIHVLLCCLSLSTKNNLQNLKFSGKMTFHSCRVFFQIPYTMMKFACFERTVEAIYQYVVPKPRAECTKSEQLVVTFAAGYIAGGKCLLAFRRSFNI